MINKCRVKCYEHTNPIKKEIFLSSLMLLRNGFVLATNIRISIFKLIRIEYSMLHIKWAVKHTLKHLLIPLFFGTPCILTNITQYSWIFDKPGEYLKILGNIGQYLAVSDLIICYVTISQGIYPFYQDPTISKLFVWHTHPDT